MVAAVMEWMTISVDVPASVAEAVADFFTAEGVPGVITDLPDGPPWSRARLEAHLPAGRHLELASALATYVGRLTASDAANVRVDVTPVPDTDWDAVFRRHHRPLVVGRRLLVAPPWDVPPAPGREVLVIEPGMAFGTGQHATTRGCLEEIEAAVEEAEVGSALDVGTGSGVLAAALARLGVPRVVACDVDPAVVPLARANLDRNRAGTVQLIAGPAGAIRARFDLVVANLLAATIVAEASALAAAVAPGGRLVVSGLLDGQLATVRTAYPAWRVAATRAAGAWRTLRLVREP